MPFRMHYNKSKRKWEANKTVRDRDVDLLPDDWGLLVSYWRWYPDKFLDLFESPNAMYGL